jgi:hypothetical protein
MARTGTSQSSFHRRNKRARREARNADRVEPRAVDIAFDSSLDLILVRLQGGSVFGFQPKAVAGLDGGTADQLANVRISPTGDGLHWEDLDVDASLTGIVVEALNLREWAPRLMGQVRSEAKAKAARKNGMKGGRPSGSSRRSDKRDSVSTR